MPIVKPKYLVDEKGQPISVVLDIEEYQRLLDDLEECGLVRAYDEAMASGEEAIPFEQAIEEIERNRP
jgi:hypothetical protein